MQIQLETKYLVYEYIKWRLLSKKSTKILEFSIQKEFEESRLKKTYLNNLIRTLCEKFESKYKKSFQRPLCSEFCITLENLENILNNVSSQLFIQNIISWSRIIALFSLSGCLVESAYEKQMKNCEFFVMNWLIEYLNKCEIVDWLESKGQWV